MEAESSFISRALFFLAWFVSFLILLGRLDDNTHPAAGLLLVLGWPMFYNAAQYFVFNRRLE